MTTELGLHHFYVDKRAGDHSSLSVIARSAALSEDDALALWRAADPGLSPQSRLDGLTDGFTGMTSEDGRRVLAHFRPRDEDPAVLRAHIVLLPDEIDPFLLIPMLAYEPFPDFEAPTDDLPDLFARHQTLSDAYDAFLTSMLRSTITDEDVLAGLIDCFIDGRHIAIRDAPPDPAMRLGLAQALSLGMPRSMRHLLSFTTDCFDGRACSAWLKFLHKPNLAIASDDVVFSWRSRQFEEPFTAQHWYSGWAAQQAAPEFEDGAAIRTIDSDPRWQTISASTDDTALALDIYAADHAWRSGVEEPQLVRFLLDHSPLISDQERSTIAGSVFGEALAAGKFSEVTELLLNGDEAAREGLFDHLKRHEARANDLVQYWLFDQTRSETVRLALELREAGLMIPLEMQARLLEVCSDREARLRLFDDLTQQAITIAPEERATLLYNIVMAYRAQKI